MPYTIAIHDWSQYTLPAALSTTNIETDTDANDYRDPAYDPGAPTWLGETFTYNGGPATGLEINDDDGNFEDGYVETGGAQTLAQDVTINGTTYLAGSVVENEFSMLDAGGNEVWVVRIDGTNVGFTYPAGQPPSPGDSFVPDTGRDGDPTHSGDGVSNEEAYSGLMVCYAPGTLIETPEGPRAVEHLSPGDQVMTLDHGPQPIRWTRSSEHALEQAAVDAKPVLIKAGALGRNLPAQELIVSPHHRILVGAAGQLQPVFDSEAFAPAKSLTSLPGIRQMKGKKRIIWIHFACDQHEIVTANGCLSESLLLGPMVLNGLQPAERRALNGIFGPAPTPDAALNGTSARDCMTVGEARRQIEKHLSEKGHLAPTETRNWDRDLAMEKYEASRMRDAVLLVGPAEQALRT